MFIISAIVISANDTNLTRARARTRARVRTCAILYKKKHQKFMPIFEQSEHKQGYAGTFDHET